MRIYVCMCNIVVHMKVSISIRRSISIHVSISITMGVIFIVSIHIG